MTTVNLPIGATNSGTNDWSDVHGEDQAITDAYNTDHASGGHPGSWLTAATVTDAKLASPNNSVYKTLLVASSGLHSAGAGLPAAGTYPVGSTLASANKSGTAGNLTDLSMPMVYFDDADYTVGVLTQKLRLRAQVSTNATALTITLTFGLYPVTFAGAANVLTATLGTVVSGSTVAIAAPGASATTQGNSGDFTIPTDGQYCVGVVFSGALDNSVACLLNTQLQTRNV